MKKITLPWVCDHNLLLINAIYVKIYDMLQLEFSIENMIRFFLYCLKKITVIANNSQGEVKWHVV